MEICKRDFPIVDIPKPLPQLTAHYTHNMSTFFDGMKKSFKDIPLVEEKIPTDEFLLASESLIKLFDLLGSSAFAVVQNDMQGNVDKIRKKLLASPVNAATLQDLILDEKDQSTKGKSATQGLLWLSRGLQFTAAAMRETVDHPDYELTKAFTDAYGRTLSKHHSFVIKPIFKLAMKACPYRVDFFKKLGDDQEKVTAQLLEWLESLENIVKIIFAFFESGNYGKGL